MSDAMLIGESRIGWIVDSTGSPVSGSARLTRLSTKLFLEVVWSNFPTSILDDWFGDISKENYAIPKTIKFFDGDTVLSLEGCSFGGNMSCTLGRGGSSSGSINVDYAVHESGNYLSISSFRSEIEGFSMWLDVPVHTALRDPEFSPRVIGATALSPATIIVGKYDGFEISFNPRCIVEGIVDGDGSGIAIKRRSFVTTGRISVSTWHSHLTVHRALKDLVAISLIRKLNFVRTHEVVGVPNSSWEQVSTSLTRAVDTSDDIHKDFLFKYDDIGAAGVIEWLKLRKRFSRGLGVYVTQIQSPASTVEDQCVAAGIAFEHLGYQIGVDKGLDKARVDNMSHRQKVALVLAEIPSLDKATRNKFSRSMSNSYNSTKHNRANPQSLGLVASDAMLAMELLQLWVAIRIGAHIPVRKQNPKPRVLSKHYPI